MNYNNITTLGFQKDAKTWYKKYKSLKFDLAFLFKSLLEEPRLGKPSGKDCNKIRMTITSKGKSGSARVLLCVKAVSGNIFLLTVNDKSEEDNFSDKELNNLLGLI